MLRSLSSGYASCLLASAGLLTGFPGQVQAEEAVKPVFEEWSLIMFDGKRCGFESTVTTQIGDLAAPRFQTVHVEEFIFKRDNAKLKMVDTSTITEDGDGIVLKFNAVSEGNGSHIESSGQREGDDLIVSSRGQTRRYPLPARSALGPEKVRRLTEAVPLQPGQAFSFQTFSSDYPQAAVIDHGVIEKLEDHTVLGTTRPLWKLTDETSILPGVPATSWIDEQGQNVEVRMNLPGLGTMDEVVSDRATCMQQPEGAEIFESTLLHPQRAIQNPHQLAQADYRLTLSDTSQPLKLWDGDEQRVLRSGPGWIEIEITAPSFTAGDATWKLPHADDADLHVYLQATSYLEVASPLIQKLAREAVGDETNPVLAAQKIEQFVRDYITKKDLNIGFASAEETAQSREGDCTEHAVLCAALGRAAGLPTRCVLGFGYIPPNVSEPTEAKGVDQSTGIFAFHMWAEAWIGPDRWVPMDAALDGFDIGHIAITKTPLDDVDPLVDLNAPIIRLLDNLKIEVLKTSPKN